VPIYNAFMQQHPDIAINFNTVGSFSDYFAKVQLQVASGAGPDVITHSPYYHVTFAAKKVTRVLDDLVARDKIDLSQLYAPLVASGRWQQGQLSTGAGSLYVIPANLNTGTIYFYNKTLFQQAGVQPPDDTWTWDTMLQAAQKMTRRLQRQSTVWAGRLHGWERPHQHLGLGERRRLLRQGFHPVHAAHRRQSLRRLYLSGGPQSEVQGGGAAERPRQRSVLHQPLPGRRRGHDAWRHVVVPLLRHHAGHGL
jgi:hypothetical protein